MTHEVRDIASRLDIALHDHIVVSATGHRSFKSMGLLKRQYPANIGHVFRSFTPRYFA